MGTAVWPGTVGAYARLMAAVNRYCTCTGPNQDCPAHKMLTDQDALNHLSFVEQNVQRYLNGESTNGKE